MTITPRVKILVYLHQYDFVIHLQLQKKLTFYFQVQLQGGGGQNSPTLSPASPAAAPFISWFQPGHSRSPSVSSIMSTTSIKTVPIMAAPKTEGIISTTPAQHL